MGAAGRKAFPQGLKPTFSCLFMSELKLRPPGDVYEMASSFLVYPFLPAIHCLSFAPSASRMAGGSPLTPYFRSGWPTLLVLVHQRVGPSSPLPAFTLDQSSEGPLLSHITTNCSWPVAWMLYQPLLHWVRVHIVQFLPKLLSGIDIEIIIAPLPESPEFPVRL